MDFDLVSGLGWREGLLAVAALLAVYVGLAYTRVRNLRRTESQAEKSPLTFSATAALAAYDAGQDGAEHVPMEVNAKEAREEKTDTLGSSDFPFPWNEPPSPQSSEQRLIALELEVDQLRKEVVGLRAEVALARVARPNREAPKANEPEISVTQLIAPQYSEAMQLAQQNIDALTISQQCGITRAEAELVAALVKNREN